jgi:hypothetical protein
MRVPSRTMSRAGHIVSPACGWGELRPRGPEVTATNVRRMGPVDHDTQGVFLFNYFFADDTARNLIKKYSPLSCAPSCLGESRWWSDCGCPAHSEGRYLLPGQSGSRAPPIALTRDHVRNRQSRLMFQNSSQERQVESR